MARDNRVNRGAGSKSLAVITACFPPSGVGGVWNCAFSPKKFTIFYSMHHGWRIIFLVIFFVTIDDQGRNRYSIILFVVKERIESIRSIISCDRNQEGIQNLFRLNFYKQTDFHKWDD